MDIEFFDGNPHAKLAAPMRTLLADARRVDAAIAFVTAHGCDLLRDSIGLPTAPKTRFVASVRFPTNLQGRADIATKFPGRVWVHTGYKEPHEVAADRGQFHSKLLVADFEGDERLVIVGRHNWTENALCGHKGLGIRVRGQRLGRPRRDRGTWSLPSQLRGRTRAGRR